MIKIEVPSVIGTVSKNEPRLFHMHLLEARDSEAMFLRCIQGWQGTQRWVCHHEQAQGLSYEQGCIAIAIDSCCWERLLLYNRISRFSTSEPISLCG